MCIRDRRAGAIREHDPPVPPTVAAESLAARKYAPPVERKAGRLFPLSALCSGALLATLLIALLSLLRYSNALIVAALLACWLLSALCVVVTTTYRKAAFLAGCIAMLALLGGLVFHNALACVATALFLLLPSIAITVSLRVRAAARRSRD